MSSLRAEIFWNRFLSFTSGSQMSYGAKFYKNQFLVPTSGSQMSYEQNFTKELEMGILVHWCGVVH